MLWLVNPLIAVANPFKPLVAVANPLILSSLWLTP